MLNISKNKDNRLIINLSTILANDNAGDIDVQIFSCAFLNTGATGACIVYNNAM